MFKSVFGKYLTAFLLIIAICFSLLVLIIAGIANQYSSSIKTSSLRDVANAIGKYYEEKLQPLQDGERVLLPEDLSDVIAASELAAAGVDRLTVILTDREGKMIAAAGADQASLPTDLQLPVNMMNQLQRANSVTHLRDFIPMLGYNIQVAHALPVLGADCVMYGAVVVFSPSAEWSGLTSVLIKTILMASLWIMLAAMIAVYFISERVNAPLTEMRRAAKDFAAGNFDTRVVVNGDDEIAELGIAFNQMANSMQNLDTVRNTFLSNVSHDLRTPMTTIAGFIDGIRDGVIPPEKQDYYLEIVSTEVHRLSRLVASLLDLSRIQAGERKFSMKPFDVCEMARQIIISSEQRIEEKRLQVEFVCDQDQMMVVADHDAIYQILYNICDNAIKFAVEDGIYRVSITEHSDKKNKIQISVYNQGQGISAEDLPFVFERFYKGDKSRGLDKKGAGLGLYIAKTIIAAHHEEIWATSKQGEDCQFNFTLQKYTAPILRPRDERGDH